MVKLQQWQARRKSGVALLAPGRQTGAAEFAVQHRAPFVEVARHQQRRCGRDFTGNVAAQLLQLALAAGAHQAQMHHQHVHALAVHRHLGVQEAALLKAVVGHVFVLVGQHRPARQHRVAVFAVAGDCVGAVHGGIA